MKWTLIAAKELNRSVTLRANWDSLNAQRGDLPFMAADAICAALAEFGTDNEILACAAVNQRTVAMFVLEKQGLLRWATFQPSQLPLSAWVAENHLELPDLTRSLMVNALSACLILSVTKIDPMLCRRPASTADVVSDDYINTAWIDIAGSFDDYWSARGKNLKQNMRKQRNKLAADDIKTHLRVITARNDIKDALARYGALESAGWKAVEGTAIHPENAQGRFYLQVFEKAANRGEALIYEYLFEAVTVAMNLCLLRDGKLFVLKTAYDESIKVLSPASLLREDELKLFFAEKQIHRVEYFGKIMEWHTKLTQEARTIFHFTHYRWAWVKRWAVRRRAEGAKNATDRDPIFSIDTENSISKTELRTGTPTTPPLSRAQE